MNLILKELKNFSKNNYYIYILFLACLALNLHFSSWSSLEMTAIFILELVWNLFLTIFIYLLHEKRFKEAYINYFISSVTFTTVGLYTFFVNDVPHVLFINTLFIIAWLRHLFIEMKGKDYAFINPASISVLAIFFSLFFYSNIEGIYLIQYFIVWLMLCPYIAAKTFKTRIFAWSIWNIVFISFSIFIAITHFISWELIWYDIAAPLLALPWTFWYIKSSLREFKSSDELPEKA